jgi:hypothetical protein
MGLFERLFRRRTTAVHDTHGYGDAHISVTRRFGREPLVELELPEAYALGLLLRADLDKLGPFDRVGAETIQIAERYVEVISADPARAREVVEMRAWLASVRPTEPDWGSIISGLQGGGLASEKDKRGKRKKR